MNTKPHWKAPRLIAINPFGGANRNPYEVGPTTLLNAGISPTSVANYTPWVGYTTGGDYTQFAVGTPGPFTDFDGAAYVAFYVSTIAPYS